MKLLNTFKHYGYSNQIGPGVYDIHSPRVPGSQEIKDRLASMLAILPDSLLFVNPVRIGSRSCLLEVKRLLICVFKDCGLKTRGWKETEASLINLVEGAKWARSNHA